MAVETFVSQLSAVQDRVSRHGVRADEVPLISGVAGVFPGTFSMCLDASGMVKAVSPSYSSSTGVNGHSMVGRRLNEFFRPAWCDERMGVVRRAMRTGTPIATVEIFRSRRLEGAYLPALDEGSSPVAVFVGRFGLTCPLPEDTSVQQFEHLLEPEWGHLSKLSRRELEVLRLIASGLDNGQIAKSIHRTKRAVEWHISGLYRSLNLLQRTDLFRIGLIAGLPEIDEEHWNRMMERVNSHHAEAPMAY
ncbi:MAG: LuxR C-terminal-related transcriptional regulator [Phycisphaerae bacterium]|jgi:DNA-binding CsgD family transcriptional regulator